MEAAVDERPEIAVLEFIGLDDVDAGLPEFIEGIRDLHAVDLRAVVQPAAMFIQPENRRASPGLIAAHAFEDPRAIVDCVREHVDFRVGEIDEPPVHPDLLDFFERHSGLLDFCCCGDSE
jgi:hypothetical protein